MSKLTKQATKAKSVFDAKKRNFDQMNETQYDYDDDVSDLPPELTQKRHQIQKD